ncbi:MAG: ketoacyl-ACP synthase III [Puniceicoccales bacterium]|jgi:3-oxoacyl-[acyl-carrier-protein] synthase-3|nr:ketoacyl-ACP synthase III [Puniceicoccales bacterium]
MTLSVHIRGLGIYTPSRRLTNHDLTRIVDTTDEWIVSRSGIKERRIAAPGETNADLAAKAAKTALEKANVSPDEIDLLIVATASAESSVPSVACSIHHKLGLRPGIPSFDVSAACSGFLYLLQIAVQMLRSGEYHNALVVASEKLSAITDWQDRSTCVLFGDGAGAAVLAIADSNNGGAYIPSASRPSASILGTVLGSDGSKGDLLSIVPRTPPFPQPQENLPVGTHVISMNGREIFRNAVRVMSQACRDVLKKCNVQPSQLALIIPHQANLRIIDAIAGELDLPLELFKVNLDRYGNTSAASIPIALDEAIHETRLKNGDIFLLVAFGGGFTWGATLLKWNQPKI